jgi:hypothetical protein
MIGVRDLISVLFLIYMLSSSIMRKEPNFTALVIFGFLLGFLRRFLPSDSLLSTSGVDLDPLLLVIPLSFLIFFSLSEISEIDGKILNISLKALIVLSTLGIFNPRQGSLLVGITGWFAYVIPILFIYLGTKMTASEIAKILNTLKILGLFVCAYGFFQVFFGYTSWDQRWFDSVTQSGDYSVVGYGTNRPFSTFSSIGEYAQAIGIAAGVVSYQFALSQIRVREFVPYMTVFVVSSSLTASRSALIITFLIALSPLLFKSRLSRTSKFVFPRFIVGAFLSAWIIPLVFVLIPPKLLGSAATLLDRQAAGLSGNASGVTSAGVHLSQTSEAFTESFRSIVGFGTGAISGAQRFNGATRMNSETDIGNASYAFGISGFIVMLTIFYGIYVAVSQALLKQGSLLILLLLPSVNNWFNPGHYSTVWLMWLLIGGILGEKRRVQHGES